MADILNKYFAKAKQNAAAYVVWVLIIAVLTALDQISKSLAYNNLKDAGEVKVIPYIFNFVYVENKGAAWGMFADNRWVFISVSSVAIIIFLLVLLYFCKNHKMLVLSLSLVTAGGIGNMIDRVFSGYVVDFIQFDFFKAFPVFNVADIYVTVGGAMLLIYLIFVDRSFFKSKPKEIKQNENNNS